MEMHITGHITEVRYRPGPVSIEGSILYHGECTFKESFAGLSKLKSVDLTGVTFTGESLSEMFQDCWNLEYVKFPMLGFGWNSEDVSAMFENCHKLKAIEGVTPWENAVNLEDMFRGCGYPRELIVNAPHGEYLAGAFQYCSAKRIELTCSYKAELVGLLEGCEADEIVIKRV